MLREGPIPRLVHGLIEYVVGVFFVAAPFLLGYDDLNVALGWSIAVGVVVLVLAAITEGPTGLVKQLPVSAHVTFDFLLAIFLIAAPFILGFGDEATPRNLFIAFGVVHLLISIGTRYREAITEGGAPSRGPLSRRSPTQATESRSPSRASDRASAPSSGATSPAKPPTVSGGAPSGPGEPTTPPRLPPDPSVPPPSS